MNGKMMNRSDRTTASSRQFKSFLIKDILEPANEEIPEDKNGDVNLQLKKESIRDWKVLKRGNQCSAKEKIHSGKGTTSRSPFQDKQRQILEKHFQESKYITQRERRKIAEETNLTDRQVKTWYQNRRTRWRKANGNRGLTNGGSLEGCQESDLAGQILSNFSEKLSIDCISQLHKQLSKK